MSDPLNTAYPIMEHFYTIQGEGNYSGTSAYFIRLGGCDVGCVWCDVKDSWDAEIHPKIQVSTLISEIEKHPAKLVVITGGEPAMHNLNALVNALKNIHKTVAIETSGTAELHGKVDWYTFSPKKFKAPIEEAYSKANELKIIVFNKSDLAWAEEHAAKVNSACLLYLQPEWSKQEKMKSEIVAYVKNNPKWRISLQTHKFLNIP